MDFGVWFDIQTNHELHVELVNQTFYIRTLFTKKDKTTTKKMQEILCSKYYRYTSILRQGSKFQGKKPFSNNFCKVSYSSCFLPR